MNGFTEIEKVKSNVPWLMGNLVGVAILQLAPFVAMASVLSRTDQQCGFFRTSSNVLDLASGVIVAAAILLTGYQLVRKRKRFQEVLSLLLGALLLVGAAQFAKMLLLEDGDACLGQPASSSNALQTDG